MILPLTTLEATLKALFRAEKEPEVPEVEFTPFDLSHLREVPRETGRPAFTEPSRVAAYPPPVPFNSPQM
jgi:hypothetical protein